MEGATLRAGAVAAVSRIRNPVLAARAVMEQSRHVLLVARGAERFARKHGVRMAPASYFHTGMRLAAVRKKLKGHHGTVGAVALDAHGNLAAATSTGGYTGKLPGRVGDSPIIGPGDYADGACAGIGIAGYEHFEGLPWRDAFLNSAMLLGGMGPVDGPKTDAGKVFAGLYALYCGLVVIISVSVVLAPVVHRAIHLFHWKKEDR